MEANRERTDVNIERMEVNLKGDVRSRERMFASLERRKRALSGCSLPPSDVSEH